MAPFIAAGVPVVCYGYGAPGEYVRDYPFGAVITDDKKESAVKAILNLRNKTVNYLRANQTTPHF